MGNLKWGNGQNGIWKQGKPTWEGIEIIETNSNGIKNG